MWRCRQPVPDQGSSQKDGEKRKSNVVAEMPFVESGFRPITQGQGEIFDVER